MESNVIRAQVIYITVIHEMVWMYPIQVHGMETHQNDDFGGDCWIF